MNKLQQSIISCHQFLAVACLLLPLSATSAQTLLSEDFESQTSGNQPSGAIAVRPKTNDTKVLIEVVDSANNPAGSGQGVRFIDNNPEDIAALEYNFVESAGAQVSAVRISFDFATDTVSEAGAKHINIAAGNFADSSSPQFGSSANRIFEARLSWDGEVQFRDGSKTMKLASGTGANTITIFINDFETAINYIAPNTMQSTPLAANTVAYYLFDGTNYFSSTAPLNGNISAGESNLGRFGITSLTDTEGLNYSFDNISVSVITAVQN